MAIFADKFTGMAPDHIAKLTDRQIEEVYMRKRNKDGSIDVSIAYPVVKAEETEETFESAMGDLDRLRMVIPEQLLSNDQVERMRMEVAERYGKAEGQEPGASP